MMANTAFSRDRTNDWTQQRVIDTLEALPIDLRMDGILLKWQPQADPSLMAYLEIGYDNLTIAKKQQIITQFTGLSNEVPPEN